MKYGDDRSDPYLDKETGILRNRLGLRTQAALDRAESTMSFLRTVELHEHPVKGSFDLAPLQATYKRRFDDLDDWAGKIRQVEIQKGDTIFARRLVIDSAAQQLFGQLAKADFLRHLDASPFSARAAHFLGKINLLHPFRDGIAAHSVN
jgi:cell filamentation protein